MNNDSKSKKIVKKILSVAEQILIDIADFNEEVHFGVSHPFSGISAADHRASQREEKYYKEKRNQLLAIWRLRDRRWIEERKEGERVVYALTTDGEIALLRIRIKIQKSILPENGYCLVVFDVPEGARKARISFRRFLKSVGFRYVQGSVWALNRNMVSEIKQLVMLLKIERWVRVYIAKEV